MAAYTEIAAPARLCRLHGVVARAWSMYHRTWWRESDADQGRSRPPRGSGGEGPRVDR
jgi:hypothetical protein